METVAAQLAADKAIQAANYETIQVREELEGLKAIAPPALIYLPFSGQL